MNDVHAYGWMFATVLFLLAVQLLPGTPTGNITVGTSPGPNASATPWIGLFVVLALAMSVGYARYRHFTRNHYHSD